MDNSKDTYKTLTHPSEQILFKDKKSKSFGYAFPIQNEEEVKQNWEKLKLKEGNTSVLQGVPKSLPALVKANRIQDKVAGVGFDWEKPSQVWKKVQERKQRKQVDMPLYQDLSLSLRVLRDFVGVEFERIRIDSKLTFEQLVEFTEEFVPELTHVMEYYPGERPIFDLFSVEVEIQRALQRKIELKSGGHLVIDQTEAMTTIDINTGAFVGHRNLEDTIFSTNIEATQAIARQLRLRNLGGIIIVDFIDMHNEDHKRRVLSSLEMAMSKDNVKFSVHGFSSLGLVEMTRKRTRESLEHVLCDECPICTGRGNLKTVDTVCFEILREIVRVNRAHDADKFIVYASSAVSDFLVNDEFDSLAEVEVFIGKSIKVQTEPMYSQEQFDVVMM